MTVLWRFAGWVVVSFIAVPAHAAPAPGRSSKDEISTRVAGEETPAATTSGQATESPPTDQQLPPVSAPPGVHRPLPNYDGRVPAPTSAGRVLIWAPRVVLMPVRYTLDFAVRRPLTSLAWVVERYKVYPWLRYLFVYRNGKTGIFPTFFYEFGLNPSVGLYFYNDDLFWRGHNLTLHGGFWSGDWLSLYLRDEYRFRGGTRLGVDASLVRRPDLPFYGIGSQTFAYDLTYYRRNRVEALAYLRRDFGGLNRLMLSAGWQHNTFDSGQYPSIDTRFDTAPIPGFGGYNLVGGTLLLRLDTRRPQLATSDTGLRLDLAATYNIDPGTPELDFIRWGGRLVGMLDLGLHHVLNLSVFTAFVEKIGSEPVPFTELVVMGGLYQMRGYIDGRFRGDSGIEITASYLYPIWAYFDAELFASIGNVYSGHLDDIAFQRMFLCWGIALRSAVSRDVTFELLVGFGTNRLDSQSVSVTNYNIAFGIHPFDLYPYRAHTVF